METPDSPTLKMEDRNHSVRTSFMISDILHSSPRNRGTDGADDALAGDVMRASTPGLDSTVDGDQAKADDGTGEEESPKSSGAGSPGETGCRVDGG